MTQEQIDALVRTQVRKVRKGLTNNLTKENLTPEQRQKRIQKLMQRATDAVCEAIEQDFFEVTTPDSVETKEVEEEVVEVVNKEPAIEVKDLWINYKTMKTYSVKKMLFERKSNKSDLFSAVRGVSFTVNKGEIWGIIGKNGSGKSTMLRAIAGIFSPDKGSVDLHDNSISLLSIGVGFKKELTGRENIMLSGMLLGFPEQMVIDKMDEIIEFSELGEFINYPVRTYSSGMYSKLAFAITSSLETDIILIDEVLSVGDEKFRKKSMQRMRELINNKDRTVVIVSHSIVTLKQLCDKMIWLHDGQIKMMGETNEVLDAYKKFMN